MTIFPGTKDKHFYVNAEAIITLRSADENTTVITLQGGVLLMSDYSVPEILKMIKRGGKG